MSRIKLSVLLTMCVVFTIVGAGMIVEGAEGAWLVFLFFGLCTAVFVNGLWPGLLLRRAPPPENLLQRFPEPIELSVNRTKFLYVTIGAAIFGGLCVWELLHRQPGWFMTIVLWLCAIGCAAAIPVAIAAMFRGSSLRLDSESLQVKHPISSYRARWADTSVFEVSSSQQQTMVVFDDVATANSILGALNSSLGGRSAVFETYGMSPEELAWLLNQWRERALAGVNGKVRPDVHSGTKD